MPVVALISLFQRATIGRMATPSGPDHIWRVRVVEPPLEELPPQASSNGPTLVAAPTARADLRRLRRLNRCVDMKNTPSASQYISFRSVACQGATYAGRLSYEYCKHMWIKIPIDIL